MQLQATKKKFPLEEAYEFAEDRGGELWSQVRRVKEDQQIRLNEPNQPSSIRRGLIIELFERYGVLEQFVRDRWPKSPAEEPSHELDRCRRLLTRYREQFGRVSCE